VFVEHSLHTIKPRCVFSKHSLHTIKPRCLVSKHSLHTIKPRFHGIQALVRFVCALLQEIKMDVGCLNMDVQGSLEASEAILHIRVQHNEPLESVFCQASGNGHVHSHLLISLGRVGFELRKVLFHSGNSFF
jgi:hypothetical protein